MRRRQPTSPPRSLLVSGPLVDNQISGGLPIIKYWEEEKGGGAITLLRQRPKKGHRHRLHKVAPRSDRQRPVGDMAAAPGQPQRPGDRATDQALPEEQRSQILVGYPFDLNVRLAAFTLHCFNYSDEHGHLLTCRLLHQKKNYGFSLTEPQTWRQSGQCTVTKVSNIRKTCRACLENEMQTMQESSSVSN